jgi:hypothetical protein
MEAREGVEHAAGGLPPAAPLPHGQGGRGAHARGARVAGQPGRWWPHGGGAGAALLGSAILGLGLGVSLSLDLDGAAGPRLAVALATGLLLGVLAGVRPGACPPLVLALLLPLLGLARRLLDAAGAEAAYDPLLLVAPLSSAWLAAQLAVTARPALQQALGRSVPARLVLLLAAYLALQAVNPLQGNLLAGLGGALFFLGPLPWFVLGLAGVAPAALARLVRLVALGAAASALSGLGQLVFGFLPAEQAWLSRSGYPSLGVGGFVRPFGTFTSAEEWSRFLELGAVLAVAFALVPPSAAPRGAGTPRRAWLRQPVWLGCAALCLAGLVASGVRSSLFGALVGLLVALVLGVRTPAGRGAVLLGAAALVPGLVVAGGLTAGPGTGVLATTAAEALLRQTWRGLVNPLGEPTLWLRLASWQEILTHDLVARPLGAGLGAASLAAQKFGGPPGVGAESYLFSLLVAGGLPAGLLFLAVAGAALGRSLGRAAGGARTGAGGAPPPDGTAVAVAAGLAALLVNSVAGSTLVLPGVAPLGWLLLGWALGPAAGAGGGGLVRRPAGETDATAGLTPLCSSGRTAAGPGETDGTSAPGSAGSGPGSRALTSGPPDTGGEAAGPRVQGATPITTGNRRGS